MKKEDIVSAYCRIREIDQTIPDEVLDYMKDSALGMLNMKELLNYYKKEIENIEEELEFCPNGNERMQGLLFAYSNIILKLENL